MKTTRIFGTRGLILATALGVSVGIASPAFAQTHGNIPVIVNPDGGLTYLGTLGGSYSNAASINDFGQVAGVSSLAHDSVRHAFITGPGGMGMTDLGTLGGSYSAAYGINDAGQVVGDFDKTGYDENSYTVYSHAFITGPDGMGMTDLGTLGGPYSYARGINDSGQVAGWSTTPDSSSHAFITDPNSMEMTALGTLGSDSFAYGINDSGQVVGQSPIGNGVWHAFTTGPDGTGMTDLNSFADLPGGGPSSAHGINNQGQIILTIVPEPASYALMLAGLGLVGFMARSKKAGRAGFLYASTGLIPSSLRRPLTLLRGTKLHSNAPVQLH